MKYFKHTTGFVTQLFEQQEDGSFVCIDQNFVAGDPVDYEDEHGSPIDPPENEGYCPFDMVGQKTPPPPKYKTVEFRVKVTHSGSGWNCEDHAFEYLKDCIPMGVEPTCPVRDIQLVKES